MHGILTVMFKRYLQGKLPRTSFFLFGPRQVGKSTLLHNDDFQLTIDLLNPELQLSYNKNPNLLYRQKDWKLSFWRTTHGAEVDILFSPDIL